MRNRLIQIVQQVGHEVVMPRYLKVAHERKSDGSLFTQADLAAQEALTVALQALHPCPILGEEMPESRQRQAWNDPEADLWCVDPIDGTSNFVHGIPYFAVSVALMRQGLPILAAIYDPVAKEVFSAEKGQGAWLNEIPLPLTQPEPALYHAIAGVDLKRLPESLALALARHPPYASQRNFGSSALEWCYVAAGRLGVSLHGGQKLWDFAAGALILEEAGGSCSTLDQDAFWEAPPWLRSVIASANPALFRAWRDWVRAHR